MEEGLDRIRGIMFCAEKRLEVKNEQDWVEEVRLHSVAGSV